jgi:hypothetical protein
MRILNYWYLITIVFFCGFANYLIWTQRGHLLRRHWKFILGYAIFTAPWAYWDAVAQRWKAYQYNPAHTLFTRIFGAEFETYIFMILVGVTVCSATIIYMQEEDKGKLRLRYSSRLRARKSHKRVPVRATAKY